MSWKAPPAPHAPAKKAKKLRHRGGLLSDIVGPATLGEWREFSVEEGDAEDVAAFDELIAKSVGTA
ncbi:hypothetical protein GL325_03145 [Aeromicrobium sp. 636]|uniref:Uncharacterized protein n=1 Tax=Aeromicrobium senzhongii TaxID=2663859 RepID=A0A8I0ESP4_9ACTN|nr:MULTISPECIES: hypothetical protein [Aeromicrobium]MBC9225314.1 hypothetical protein [Aeromicrobium senzhongii]MCQ3997424.1 hypothetical protein [Aeromicrobium sp. 636]